MSRKEETNVVSNEISVAAHCCDPRRFLLAAFKGRVVALMVNEPALLSVLRWTGCCSGPYRQDKESESMRLSRFKKIKDDFRDLQSLNNKMMADAWLQDTLDYSSIAEMVSKIRGKANDLKESLSLPESEKSRDRFEDADSHYSSTVS
jgi:hypothetical protein